MTFSSAYDLYVVPSHGQISVKTDIKLQVQTSYYASLEPRSLKDSITVGAGVIDADYSKNVIFTLSNSSEDDFEVKKSDRIAQLIPGSVDIWFLKP